MKFLNDNFITFEPLEKMQQTQEASKRCLKVHTVRRRIEIPSHFEESPGPEFDKFFHKNFNSFKEFIGFKDHTKQSMQLIYALNLCNLIHIKKLSFFSKELFAAENFHNDYKAHFEKRP